LENCLIEAPTGISVNVGKDVIISHGVTVHGAKIEDGSIVGIGVIVLDNASIGERSFISLGALISPRTEIHPNQLVLVVPAKTVRECKKTEHDYMNKEHEPTFSKAKIYKVIYKK
jgi:carbonic anhydrase/acetyltransferase-like protein (isoleucine patch superfamily)